ncbi:MAG: hypothetical protein AAB573_04090 [Patescibacteria group bacterium]
MSFDRSEEKKKRGPRWAAPLIAAGLAVSPGPAHAEPWNVGGVDFYRADTLTPSDLKKLPVVIQKQKAEWGVGTCGNSKIVARWQFVPRGSGRGTKVSAAIIGPKGETKNAPSGLTAFTFNDWMVKQGCGLTS